MKLTKTSAHAALAMAFLSSTRGDQPVQARQVAEHLGVPTDSALKVLQRLSRQGLLQSRLGRSGGYRLSRPAAAVTLLQVVETIDGPITTDMPVSENPDGQPCAVGLLRRACDRSIQRQREELGRLTVADLAACNEPDHASAPALTLAG
ncbi:MAG: Rrf2 family transcriptional regulator [Planctomycetota bacterium]